MDAYKLPARLDIDDFSGEQILSVTSSAFRSAFER